LNGKRPLRQNDAARNRHFLPGYLWHITYYGQFHRFTATLRSSGLVGIALNKTMGKKWSQIFDAYYDDDEGLF
jgi:hypothetical protein